MKNDLLLRVLAGEETERPPVWMMRQAGRYLPDYRKLRDRYDFFTRVQTPELATAITLQPVDQIGVDAAILFSDILVIPQAMGMKVELIENKGPLLPNPIRNSSDIDALQTDGVEDSLSYVMDAIRLTRTGLNGRVPLIGFAGAPWTIFCYMVEGRGSKTFETAKAFCFQNPAEAHRLLSKITLITIDYLRNQAEAGAQVLQVFDSWSGMLSPEDFQSFSQPYLLDIVDALKDSVPVILFPKGSWYALPALAQSEAAAIGVDWCIAPQMARELAGARTVLQGNFDPSHLLAPLSEIKRSVHRMIEGFGQQHYIANLGHGILPYIPVDHARAFVEAVQTYQPIYQ